MVGPAFFGRAGFGGESRMVALLRRYLPGALSELVELAYNIPAYLRLKAAWRAEKPDFVYERCNLYFLAGSWLARRHKVRLFLEVNSPLADEREKHGGLRLAWLARRLERFTWRSAERVLPVTAVLAGILAENGVDPARITVIPNGIDPARFPPRAPAPAGSAVTLGFVGFVRAWHGLDRVIEGMQAGAPNTRLVVVGEGPAIPDLQALAAKIGVAPRVIFAGLVPPEQIGAHVQNFDVALQPSATPYASPLKIFDYMAAGCAIVAPDQPNIREILTQDETALLFDPADPAAMWRAIEQLAADAALRDRLGRAARTVLERRDYTWSGNAARLIRLVNKEERQDLLF
jgi:glycosyltransferase involved in cell wall biosynthesis